MPRRKFINKKEATTFTLVHRAQNDPRIHDEDAPSMVFAEKAQQQPRRPTEDDYAYSSAGSVASSDSAVYRSTKVKNRGDLEDEFGLSVRRNEGEAAQHAVFFDDSEYDYMQHMRDLGAGEGGVVWVEAAGAVQKGKGKQRLEDALRDVDLNDAEMGVVDEDLRSTATHSTTSSARSLFPEEMFGSEFVRRRTYQDQQDIPDEIAGLQPDMHPDLREVLEALDDEAYVEDEDEDFFAELTKGGREVEKDVWEHTREQQLLLDGEEDGFDDGWESDDTIRASSPPPPPSEPPPALNLPEGDLAKPPEDTQAIPPADPTDGAWLDEFKKFKSASKKPLQPAIAAVAAPPSASLDSSALASLATGPKKKRKGAKTSTTNYSMTSSALARTDQQTLLDERFDKFEAGYDDDDALLEEESDVLEEASSMISGVSGVSRASNVSKYSNASGMSNYSRASDVGAPRGERSDFDSIMDEFLGGGVNSSGGKLGRRGKRGGESGQVGLQQLDEVRKGLGPARVKSRIGTVGS